MNQLTANPEGGFRLIELMIFVAVIAIFLTMAVPAYSKHKIRAKVGESLSLAATAKIAITSTCQEDMTITNLTPQNTGYYFQETKYVFNIELSGPCLAPIITVTTQTTGAQPDPVLTISGDFALNNGGLTWTCLCTSLDVHVPESC